MDKIWPISSCGACNSCSVVYGVLSGKKWHCYQFNLDILNNTIIHPDCKLDDEIKFKIGDKLTDEHGNISFVGIKWNDGDFCTIVNDAAHADPRKI